ncbi:TPA: Cj1386 family hemin-binding protein, partial [Campylobacter jejuni]|nr:Cj1386 family hemin-binding protein [Campylobacter jejuni]
GANIDENNGLGMTPYTFAIMFGRKDVAEFLLKKSKNNFLKKISLKILKFIKKF